MLVMVPSGKWVTFLTVSSGKMSVPGASSSGGGSRLDFFFSRGSSGGVGGMVGARLVRHRAGRVHVARLAADVTSRGGALGLRARRAAACHAGAGGAGLRHIPRLLRTADEMLAKHSRAAVGNFFDPVLHANRSLRDMLRLAEETEQLLLEFSEL